MTLLTRGRPLLMAHTCLELLLFGLVLLLLFFLTVSLSFINFNFTLTFNSFLISQSLSLPGAVAVSPVETAELLSFFV